MDIVCRLGGFHTLMSFIGSIGTVMSGSGLEEVFGQIYAENVVPYLKNGKAIARALRAHICVDAALNKKLISVVMDGNAELSQECVTDQEKSTIEQLLVNILSRSAGYNEISGSGELQKLSEELELLKSDLRSRSRTARLWLQYLELLTIVKNYIRAERSGNWHLHLTTTYQMLPIFAATGHIHYAKSTRLYLQLMQELPDKYPWLYEQFLKGKHAIHRTNHPWSGLWSDLVIEQVLMRSLKSRGGLTRGRGMTESVRHQWVHSMHRCASVHSAMTTLTDLSTNTSDQHAELGVSRCKRDAQDIEKLISWFDDHDPFDCSSNDLRSLSTGLSATDDDGISCDRAEEIGLEIQKTLDEVNVADATIKRKKQVKTLSSLTNNVKIGKTDVEIDPKILFMRLIAMIQREDNISDYFDYELTTTPLSLFKDGMMRKAQKVQLRHALVENIPSIVPRPGEYVLDGGALLHKVRWVKGHTYSATVYRYTNYVIEKYGKCHVVFDGYENVGTIKDQEHLRRNVKTSANIEVLPGNVNHNNQEAFLSNSNNKSQFITLLSKSLKLKGITVVNCKDDADTQIVSCALEIAHSKKSVTVVADDTDVFVLLIYHYKDGMNDVYFHSDKACKTWEIGQIVTNIGPVMQHHLLFLHAWTGCDSTSAIYGHGKTSLIRKLEKDEILQQQAKIISNPWATHEEIAAVSERIFVKMYGGKNDDTLGNLRYEIISCSRNSLLMNLQVPKCKDKLMYISAFYLYAILLHRADVSVTVTHNKIVYNILL